MLKSLTKNLISAASGPPLTSRDDLAAAEQALSVARDEFDSAALDALTDPGDTAAQRRRAEAARTLEDAREKVASLQAAHVCVRETLGESLERPAQVNGGEQDQGCQGTGDGPLERQEKEEHLGQQEEGNAGHERTARPEDHRIRADAVDGITFVVADLLGQVTGRERQAEEETEDEPVKDSSPALEPRAHARIMALIQAACGVRPSPNALSSRSRRRERAR